MKRHRPAINRLWAPETVLFPHGRKVRRHYLIDALRGLAAFAVLFWHYQHFLFPIGNFGTNIDRSVEPGYAYFAWLFENGALAVPVFWIISGFVFTNVYINTGTDGTSFVANRFARLYPLHFLTLVVVALLQAIAAAEFGVNIIYRHNDPQHFLLHLGFASNWFSLDESFNGPVWSVSVEIIIYAVFWLTHRWLVRFGAVLPILLALTFAVPAILLPNYKVGSCGHFFFLGGALATVSSALERDARLLLALIGTMMLVGLGGFLAGPPLTRMIGVPAFFGGLILLLVALEPQVSRQWRRPLSWIGDNTYGMYLLHVPIQLTIFVLLGRRCNISLLAMQPWFLCAFLGASIIVGRLSFVCFERPMRSWLRSP